MPLVIQCQRTTHT